MTTTEIVTATGKDPRNAKERGTGSATEKGTEIGIAIGTTDGETIETTGETTVDVRGPGNDETATVSPRLRHLQIICRTETRPLRLRSKMKS